MGERIVAVGSADISANVHDVLECSIGHDTGDETSSEDSDVVPAVARIIRETLLRLSASDVPSQNRNHQHGYREGEEFAVT